uniref:Persulfide dioxygenase ETHE1, mitochondrial n=1 Tax=Schistocephalus solidus TaxID=70667 RepID=A0A183SYT2_SCHSO
LFTQIAQRPNLSSHVLPNLALLAVGSPFIFRQLFDPQSSTYTYLIGDAQSREALIIDPVLEKAERDVDLVKALDLRLLYAINTHVHADHVTGTQKLKQDVKGCRSVISALTKAKADVFFNDGDVIRCGSIELECRSTPGHTPGCTTFVLHSAGAAFTGDALLIRGCGRTDFQEGSADMLYDSVHSKILSLPRNYLLFPAHDYTGRMDKKAAVGSQPSEVSCEAAEPSDRLTKSKAEFIEIMNNLNLPRPKLMDHAVPLNLLLLSKKIEFFVLCFETIEQYTLGFQVEVNVFDIGG